MNEKDRKDAEQLRYYLLQIGNVIEQINSCFGENRVRLLLNFSLLDEACSYVTNSISLHSKNITSNDAARYNEFSYALYNKLRDIEHDINSADNILVICKNDRKQPKNLFNRLLLGEVYKVTQITVNKKGNTYFRLKGINDEKGYTKLSSRRFTYYTSNSLT